MILVNFRHRIQAPDGVHARPAGYLADLARKYLDICTIKIGRVDVMKSSDVFDAKSVESSDTLKAGFPKVSVSEQVSCTSGMCQFNSSDDSEKAVGSLGTFCDVSQIFSVMKMGLRKGDEVVFCIRGKDRDTEKKVELELNSLLAKHF